jgi:hypothetical protein
VNQICFARQSTETSSSLSSDNESSLSWPKAGKTATAFALAAFSLFCFRNISIRSDMVLSVQTKQNFVNHTASTMMVFCNEQQLWQQGYYYQQDHVMAFKQANSVSTTTTTTKEVENQSKYPIPCFKTHETSRSQRNKKSFTFAPIAHAVLSPLLLHTVHKKFKLLTEKTWPGPSHLA